MELPIWQRWFCSVGSPCIAEAIHWSQPSDRIEKWLKIWSWCRLDLQKYHPSLICCSARAAYRQYITGLSIYYRDMTCFDGLYLKHRVCFQRCMTKYWYFTWDKRSTARRAVMVHSTRRIALILASFKVALPSKSKKPSWIDWTIKISPRALGPPHIIFC